MVAELTVQSGLTCCNCWKPREVGLAHETGPAASDKPNAISRKPSVHVSRSPFPLVRGATPLNPKVHVSFDEYSQAIWSPSSNVVHPSGASSLNLALSPQASISLKLLAIDRCFAVDGSITVGTQLRVAP
jgi:hypothetical protein